MFALKPISTEDLIAILSAAIAFAAFLAAFWYSRGARRDSLRVEKSNAYLELEVASSEVFKYESEHATALKPYRKTRVAPTARAKLLADGEKAAACDNLYYQTLNLFEVCTRFRRQDIIEHEVFASWVAWFYHTLDDWYFRHQWPEIRPNYTSDVRDIFDLGMRAFEEFGDSDDPEVDAARQARFYQWVAAHMQCTEIADWLSNVRMEAVRPAPPPGRLRRYLIRNGWRMPPTAERRPIS